MKLSLQHLELDANDTMRIEHTSHLGLMISISEGAITLRAKPADEPGAHRISIVIDDNIEIVR